MEFDGPGYKEQNGPGIGRAGMKPAYGIGFTVSGTVVEGGIGRVEVPGRKKNSTATEIVNPKGSWTIQQMNSFSSSRAYDSWFYRALYNPIYDSAPTHADGPAKDFRTIVGNDFVYGDHPGPFVSLDDGTKLSAYSGEWDFDIKLIRGSQACEVRFHVSMSLQNGNWQTSWSPR